MESYNLTEAKAKLSAIISRVVFARENITIRKMSRMLQDPKFPVHHMHNGRRCKVHLVEFISPIGIVIVNLN